MGATWIGSWEGGRIRVTSKGKRVYVLERDGAARYPISLKASTEREALAELDTFKRDPAAYRARLEGRAGELGAEPLLVTVELITEFCTWCTAQDLNEQYVRGILRKYLVEWSAALKGRDLRKVATVELRKLLAKWPTAKKHRVISLKAFTAWLRTEAGLLTSQTDPTLDLASIRGKKRKAEDEAKAYELEDVEAVYRAIDYQQVRDEVVLTFKRGVHLTELGRFARGLGKLRAVGPWDGCPIVGTLTVNHKNGDPHTISLDAQDYAAALRIRERGRTSRSWTYQHLAAVAARNSLPHLLLGSGRHSFVTWCRTPGLGVEKFEPPQPGVSLEDVMVVTGHRSAATPRHHYDEARHIPHLLQVPLRLVHPDDPPLGKVVKLRSGRAGASRALATKPGR